MGTQVAELASVTLLTLLGLILHAKVMSFCLNIGFYNPSRKWCRPFSPVFDFSLGETGAPAELDVEGGRTDIFGRGWSGEAISDRR